MAKQTTRTRVSPNRLLSERILKAGCIALLAGFYALSVPGCGEKPTPYKLNEEMPLGLGKLTVLAVEYNTLNEYIAPNTYEGVIMAEKMIKENFLAGPDHVPVCVIFKYDTSDSKESKENQQEAIAAFSVAQLYSIVDSENNKYPAKLLVPKNAVSYQQPGAIMDLGDLKQAMQKLLWEDERVAAFSVPKDRSGLSLLIKNPMRRKGQPEMVKVSLSS